MQDYIKVASQAAKSVHNEFPYTELNELQAQSHLIMMEAFNSFNPVKGRSMKSWIGFMVHRELRKMIKKEQINSVEYDDLVHCTEKYDPERMMMFKQTIDSFSAATQEAVNLVTNELITEKQEIKNRLRNKGFAWNKIQKAFFELREYANSIT